MTASSTNREPVLRVLRIVEGTSVDGTGLRTSIYFAGCENRCEGCHNPQSWDPDGGEAMTVDSLLRRIAEAGMNVTLSGGDPLLHPVEVGVLLQRIKSESDKTVWCYTGYTFEEVMSHPARRAVMQWVDVLVDGRYMAAERDTSLRFRGSRNQRIIDVPRSLVCGKAVLLDENRM